MTDRNSAAGPLVESRRDPSPRRSISGIATRNHPRPSHARCGQSSRVLSALARSASEPVGIDMDASNRQLGSHRSVAQRSRPLNPGAPGPRAVAFGPCNTGNDEPGAMVPWGPGHVRDGAPAMAAAGHRHEGSFASGQETTEQHPERPAEKGDFAAGQRDEVHILPGTGGPYRPSGSGTCWPVNRQRRVPSVRGSATRRDPADWLRSRGADRPTPHQQPSLGDFI